jgi:lipoprotein-anchoring transpeptidase ErfK/SrfK
MRRISELRIRKETKAKLATLVATLLLTGAKALAQDQPTARADFDCSHVRPAAERRIIVSISDRKLALVENGRVVRTYRVAVGAPQSPSPSGKFKVANRITDPTYYAPGVVIPTGKDNPLGPRWLGLSQKGLGIHGTNQPLSIGHRASHGCIRMRNTDIAELFKLVRVGDVVELHSERTQELAEIFGTVAASSGGGQ